MELIKNIFSNQWVVNIGTGLIVYIVSAIISKAFFSKAADKERQKRIENANIDVIRILKPYVLKTGILNTNTILSVIESIARKYDLKGKEVYSIKEICEELTREILENPYLDSDKKSEYLQYLNRLINESIKENNVGMADLYELEYNIKFHREKMKLYNRYSIMMILIVLLICIFVTAFSSSSIIDPFTQIPEPVQISVVIVITELGMLMSLVYIGSYRKRRKSKDKEEENNEYRE